MRLAVRLDRGQLDLGEIDLRWLDLRDGDARVEVMMSPVVLVTVLSISMTLG